MGELQTEPFQFTFNGFLKVAFQGSRITSDAGLILVRELDERLGLAGLTKALVRTLAETRHARRAVIPVGDAPAEREDSQRITGKGGQISSECVVA